jgi:uncharacterized iron-regulated protein
MMSFARALAVGALILAGSAIAAGQTGYVPGRVFASARKQFADFEVMLADLARADVVFVGEQHDDGNSHRLELALLEGLALRRGEIILSLEMFDRDVQEALDHFQMGHVPEADFLKESRPWPGYESDYKPLVDFAIAKSWPVIAANVPRPVAADVIRSGLDVLNTKPDAQKAWFARELRCPTNDEYFKRFVRVMASHAGPPNPDRPGPENVERYYLAQCLKDETMGESIASVYGAAAVGGKHPMVVHLNGAFHSDFGDGVVARTRRRLPGKRVVTLTILPTENLDLLAPDAETRRRADYLVYTVGK